MTMAFKLMQSAQRNWIKLRGFHHLDNVIRGVKFKNGQLEKNANEDVLLTETQNRIAA
jgi:putative transposase